MVAVLAHQAQAVETGHDQVLENDGRFQLRGDLDRLRRVLTVVKIQVFGDQGDGPELRPQRGMVLSVFFNLDPSEFATPAARATELNSVVTAAARKVEDEETRATASQALHAGGHYLVVLDYDEADFVCDYIRGNGCDAQ